MIALAQVATIQYRVPLTREGGLVNRTLYVPRLLFPMTIVDAARYELDGTPPRIRTNRDVQHIRGVADVSEPEGDVQQPIHLRRNERLGHALARVDVQVAGRDHLIRLVRPLAEARRWRREERGERRRKEHEYQDAH